MEWTYPPLEQIQFVLGPCPAFILESSPGLKQISRKMYHNITG